MTRLNFLFAGTWLTVTAFCIGFWVVVFQTVLHFLN